MKRLIFAWFLAAPTAFSQIVNNSGFESGDVGQSASIPGWTATGNVSCQNYTTPHGGRQFIAFNSADSTPNGTLSQTIPTAYGAIYVLTFYQGCFAWRQTASHTLKVFVSGTDGTSLASATFNLSAIATISLATAYTQRTVIFVANGASTTIRFIDDGANPTVNTDLLLDDVAVNPATSPIITIQPQSVWMTAGHPATFAVTALSAGGAPHYQWRRSGADIGGATSPSYTIPSVTAADAADYVCAVTDSNGTAISTAAKLIVPKTPVLLAVNPTNPRYFKDPQGKAVFLTGIHTFLTIQDADTKNFDYHAFFDRVAANNCNFVRLWQMDRWFWPNGFLGGASPAQFQLMPFARSTTAGGTTSTGTAYGNKFDLTTFNDAYFTTLRNRITEAERHGIYCSVQLFDMIWRDNGRASDWTDSMYRPVANNINGYWTNRSDIYTTNNIGWYNAMTAYADHLVDVLNDLDNYVYEIGNEGPLNSSTFQNNLAQHIRDYESQKPKQHPIGISAFASASHGGGTDSINNAILNGLTAPQWIAPSQRELPSPSNPIFVPDAVGTRVSVLDTDHTWGWGLPAAGAAGADWVWRALTHGHNPIYLTVSNGVSRITDDDGLINALGAARTVTQRCDLDHLTPHGELTNTGHALVNPGIEYLVYQPSNTAITITGMPKRLFNQEWIDATTGTRRAASRIQTIAGTFDSGPPPTAPVVLHLWLVSPTPLPTPVPTATP